MLSGRLIGVVVAETLNTTLGRKMAVMLSAGNPKIDQSRETYKSSSSVAASPHTLQRRRPRDLLSDPIPYQDLRSTAEMHCQYVAGGLRK